MQHAIKTEPSATEMRVPAPNINATAAANSTAAPSGAKS